MIREYCTHLSKQTKTRPNRDSNWYKKLIRRWEYPNVTWRISSYLFTYAYRQISTEMEVPITHNIDHTLVNLIQLNTLNLNLTSQNIYSTLMCRLRIFAGQPIYHLPGKIISATVGPVYIDVQTEYELSSRTRFGQFQKFGKNELRALCSQPLLR